MLFFFLLAVGLQVLVWALILSRAFEEDTTPTAHDQPVSVIVCFKNEVTQLERCLRGILTQQHPDFEVLAVDDHSSDGSAAIVRRLQLEFSNLRLLKPSPTRPGKKDALTHGIRAARYELLLLTDADCVPASEEWLSRMTAPLIESYEVVLGCSPYLRSDSTLNLWQRYETTYTALQYLGLAKSGFAYMGVGRNLAYHREFFTRSGGFYSHGDLPGGDDDLLVGGNALASTTARVTHPDAWTYSTAAGDLPTYLRQKLRHQSAGRRYRPVHQGILSAIAVSHGLFYLLGLLLLFTVYWQLAVLVYGIRLYVVLSVMSHDRVKSFLGGDAGALRVVCLDALLAPFVLFLAVATAAPPRRW